MATDDAPFDLDPETGDEAEHEEAVVESRPRRRLRPWVVAVLAALAFLVVYLVLKSVLEGPQPQAPAPAAESGDNAGPTAPDASATSPAAPATPSSDALTAQGTATGPDAQATQAAQDKSNQDSSALIGGYTPSDLPH